MFGLVKKMLRKNTPNRVRRLISQRRPIQRRLIVQKRPVMRRTISKILQQRSIYKSYTFTRPIAKFTNVLGFNRHNRNSFRVRVTRRKKPTTNPPPTANNVQKPEPPKEIPQPRRFNLANPDSNIEIPYPARLGQTFVISIRPHRFADFKKRFGPWSEQVTLWPGIDGAKLDKEKMVRDGSLAPSYNGRVGETSLRRGEIGCYLAHYTLWQHIVKNNIPQAFIMEDDADIPYCEDVANLINKTFDDIKRNNLKYDILYFGHAPQSCENIYPGTEIGVLKDCPGCFAYCVTLECAQKLVQQMMPIRGPVDMILLEKRNQIRQLALEPALCYVVKVVSDTGTIW